MELFEQEEPSKAKPRAPLADRIRPEKPEEFVGQRHILAPGKPLYEYLGFSVQGDGWHRRFSTHNLLFLDLHAASTHLDSRQLEGRDWSVTDFLAVSTGFYP